MTKTLATKIKAETRSLSREDHDSILRDTVEEMKHFHWDTVMLEFMRNAPLLDESVGTLGEITG